MNTSLFFVDFVVSTWTDVDTSTLLQQSLKAKLEQLNISDDQLIRLDWILTPSAHQIQESVISGREPSSLYALVKETNRNIAIFMESIYDRKVNVILVDFADQTDAVRVAAARTLCSSTPCRDEDINGLFRVSERCLVAPTCANAENTPLAAAAPLGALPIATEIGDTLNTTASYRPLLALTLVFVASLLFLNE